MRNLTANATKNTDASRVPVIHWTASEANGQVLLQLTDNGKGADPDAFKALFDETVVSSTRTGLGLHLVRDLAKAIGCKIEVESHIGQGTTFRLYLLNKNKE